MKRYDLTVVKILGVVTRFFLNYTLKDTCKGTFLAGLRGILQMEHRMGETGLLPFRTRRVFNIGSEWFFAVREGKDRGPFENKQTAISELNLFLNNFELKKAH